MFIIFGWGKTIIKNLGPVFENLCSHCNNKEYWRLVKTTVWFTLFYIPVIPYETHYSLLCPVCEYGIKLDRQKFDELKPLAESNQALINGKITQAQHANNLKQLASGSLSNIASPNNGGRCNNCNQQNPAGTKFCKNCGAKF
jgi:hypothetical protein